MTTSPEPSGGPDRLHGVVQAGLRYAEARGRLLQIEAAEAGSLLRRTLVSAAVTAAAFAGAWLLIVPAAVVWAAERFALPWAWLSLGLGVLHLLIGFLALRRLWGRLAKARLFEESRNQWHIDRAWLAKTQEP